jgi:predicted CXXCH cytochrome family protein
MWPIVLLMLVGAPQPGPAVSPAASSCVICHLQLEGALLEPARLFEHDIHFREGLSCNACHGGDPTVGIDTGGPGDAMNRAKGYIGVPPRKKIAALCASCHSSLDFMRRYNPQARVDQYAEYLTSVHGKKYMAGDPNVATCTSCHGVHGILAVSNPNSPVYPTNVASTCARCHADPKRMKGYGIPTDQFELYSRSVHAEELMKNNDLGAPTCNDCHGNHGAVPPGVSSVANVCGQCHTVQWDLFDKSPHKRAFAQDNLPACATCHENHDIHRTSDAMLGVEEQAICITCHDQGSKGYIAAAEMKAGVVDLRQRLDSARQLLERAERAGMEVSGPLYNLSEGRNQLIQARVAIHSFSPAGVQKFLAEGDKIAAAGKESGEQALDELSYRRKGLAVSGAILLCMIGLLVIKIRQLGK